MHKQTYRCISRVTDRGLNQSAEYRDQTKAGTAPLLLCPHCGAGADQLTAVTRGVEERLCEGADQWAEARGERGELLYMICGACTRTVDAMAVLAPKQYLLDVQMIERILQG